MVGGQIAVATARHSPPGRRAGGHAARSGFVNVPRWRRRHHECMQVARVGADGFSHDQPSLRAYVRVLISRDEDALVEIPQEVLVSVMAVIGVAPDVRTAGDYLEFARTA